MSPANVSLFFFLTWVPVEQLPAPCSIGLHYDLPELAG